jgi:hypothetical protein
MRTLALLLPEHDKDVEIWFKQQKAKFQKRRNLPLDPLARECGQLKVEERQIDNFEYWHDRLVILKQVFDEAERMYILEAPTSFELAIGTDFAQPVRSTSGGMIDGKEYSGIHFG